MAGQTLKKLLQDNIQLATDSIMHDDANTIFNEIYSQRDIFECNAQAEKVKNSLHQLLSVYENLPELIFDTALKLDDKEIYEEALFYYRLSNVIRPNPKAFNNIAIVYANLNRTKYAIEILEQGKVLFPENETIIENLKILK
jgi:tetratricopeptide (TPR) repeat protein